MAKKNFPSKGKAKFKGKSMKFKNFKGKKGPKKSKFDVNARLIVRNLSFKSNEDSLKQHFEPYGRVFEVSLPRRPNGDLVGCGFVQYEFIEHAKLALTSRNNQPFLGRSIQVDWAVSKSDYVKNQNVEQNSEIEIKSEQESNDEHDVKQEEASDNETSRPYQKFSERAESSRGSRQFNKPQSDVDSQETKAERIKRKARLIIRNIPFKATEESLKAHFSPYGEVLESVLLKKPSGELVGCGFIQFKNVQSATKAMLKTNSKPFIGRQIFVDWAVPKNKYMAHVTQKQDEEEYLQNDVKSEPESDAEDVDVKPLTTDVKVKSESDAESGSEDADENDDDKEDEDSEDEDDDEEEDEGDSGNEENGEENDAIDIDASSKKVSAYDAEDGRTVFIRNLSFNAIKEDLEQFAQQFGDINYALVCIDKLTEHSKGTGFIRFKNKEDAEMCLRAAPDQLSIQGQNVEVLPALFRENSKGKDNAIKKQPKDSRNLYLIKEGVILANSKAAVGVSASDMAKRLALEQKKTEMLKNLNRFISRYRLNIHNVPPHYADEDLKKVCLEMANVKPYGLKECRIMKHMKGPMTVDGKYQSKGYAFVSFSKHESALTCLRRMNNNPNIFDKNNRPIVSFSIEDKSVINARQKRLEKSKLRNPLHKRYDPQSGKEKHAKSTNDSTSKNGKLNNKSIKIKKGAKPGKNFAKTNSEESKTTQNVDHSESPYVGEIAKPGKPLKMRNRYKLKMQANMHRENVKQEKRKEKMSKLSNKIKAKERVKQPKQKQNTSEKKGLKKMSEMRQEKSFSDMVSQYKSKLVGNSSDIKIKSKWYEKK